MMNRRSQLARCMSLVALCLSVTACGVPSWLQVRGQSSQPFSTSNGAAADAGRQANNTAAPGDAEPPARTARPVPLPAKAMITVPAQDQMPQLPNGCEVTSLSMLLSAVGHPIDKMVLAREEPTDPTPLVRDANGKIVSWGNPNVGFVGNPAIQPDGYGIYHGPMAKFLNQLMPGQAVDLTGLAFDNILASVAHGMPVVVWDTADFQPTDSWITWSTPEGPIRVTMEEHAVLVVGYDPTHIYVNNPLTGQQAQAIDRSQFIAAWKQLGEQAITLKSTTQPQYTW